MPNIKRIPFIRRKGDKEELIQPTRSKPAQGLDESIDEVEDWGSLTDSDKEEGEDDE